MFSISNLRITRVVESKPAFDGKITPTFEGKYLYFCPWELKHVTSITMTVNGNTAKIGIPNKPASRSQIFDTGGAIRTFKISGIRYDAEETIPNIDFIHKELNFARDPILGGNREYCYVGLSWLFSKMQVVLKGYQFYIGNADPTDKRFIHFPPFTADVVTNGWNVAVTAMSTEFPEDMPGAMTYDITMVERMPYGEVIYKPYQELTT
jgi:hypothetical protein